MGKCEKDIKGTPYMGWPFMTNINSTVQNELTRRAADRNRSLSPFIKTTPGVTIDNKKVILKSLEDSSDAGSPSGFKFTELYRPDSSMRPLAGITGFEVDFKNKFGSVRRGTVTWLCHTMEDLERLWVYFMNPSKTLLVEWGWNEGAHEVDTSDDYTGENWDIFKYYDKLRKKVLSSSCNYDAMVGFITNYSFSINSDGSITCTSQVTSPGMMMEGLDMKHQYSLDPMGNLQEYVKHHFDSFITNEYNSKKSADNPDDVYIHRANSDSNNDSSYSRGVGGPKNTSSDNEDYSTKQFFLSWGFIEDKILNPRLKIVNIDEQLLFGFDSNCTKIGNHKHLRSVDQSVCIVPNVNSGHASGKSGIK